MTLFTFTIYTALCSSFSLGTLPAVAFRCASSRLSRWNEVESRTSTPAVHRRLFAASSEDDEISSNRRQTKRSSAFSTSKNSSNPMHNSNRRNDDRKPKHSKQQIQSDPKRTLTNLNQEKTMFIQFSRVFQRHVVYRHQPSNNDTNWDGIGDATMSPATVEVLESFDFLDEATEKYPGIPVLAPKDLPFPPPTCSIEWDSTEGDEGGTAMATTLGAEGEEGGRVLRKRRTDVEQDECETTVAGMGLTTLCELEYEFDCVECMSSTNSLEASSSSSQRQGAENSNIDQLGYQYDQARLAIQTLLRLVTTPESQVNLPRHFFRLDPKRFASRGLTSDVINKNYNRLTQLLSGTLEMKQRDIDFVMSNFPQLCLYNSDEVECMIQFLISPLPPQEFVSVVMVAEKGIGGASVDCELLFCELTDVLFPINQQIYVG